MLGAVALRGNLSGPADFITLLAVCFLQKVLDLMLLQKLALLVEDLR